MPAVGHRPSNCLRNRSAGALKSHRMQKPLEQRMESSCRNLRTSVSLRVKSIFRDNRTKRFLSEGLQKRSHILDSGICGSSRGRGSRVRCTQRLEDSRRRGCRASLNRSAPHRSIKLIGEKKIRRNGSGHHRSLKGRCRHVSREISTECFRIEKKGWSDRTRRWVSCQRATDRQGGQNCSVIQFVDAEY